MSVYGPEIVTRVRVREDGEEERTVHVRYIDGLEVKNPKLITVLYECKHIFIRPRPAGGTDPMNCLCISCHPEPIAYRDWLCPDCSTQAIKERYQVRN